MGKTNLWLRERIQNNFPFVSNREHRDSVGISFAFFEYVARTKPVDVKHFRIACKNNILFYTFKKSIF